MINVGKKLNFQQTGGDQKGCNSEQILYEIQPFASNDSSKCQHNDLTYERNMG